MLRVEYGVVMKRLFLLLLIGLLGAGCESQSGFQGRLRVGMMPKLTGIPYFNACELGARTAAKELGIELIYDGPETADSNKQIEIINSWIVRGFDAIAVAPNNPQAIAPILERARSRGIRVVTWDTDSIQAAREIFCNQVSNSQLAGKLVDIVAQGINSQGTVALISGTETAANQNAWMREMRTYAGRHYPDLVFINPVEYPGEDEVRAYQSAAGFLRRSPRPDAIVGMTSVSTPAVARAVLDAGLAGEVIVTGVVLPKTLRPFIEKGVVQEAVLWNPEDLGYLTVYAAVGMAESDISETPSMNAGRLGSLKIKEGEVLLGEPLVFTRENITQYDF